LAKLCLYLTDKNVSDTDTIPCECLKFNATDSAEQIILLAVGQLTAVCQVMSRDDGMVTNGNQATHAS
jgi:hypothetical protein